MPSIFQEGRQQFEFDDHWSVEKYDDAKFYRKLCEQVVGTKAVDFVRLENREAVWFIELKDFRGHKIDNKHRWSAELPGEFAQKIRDTLPGLIVGHLDNERSVLFGEILKKHCKAASENHRCAFYRG